MKKTILIILNLLILALCFSITEKTGWINLDDYCWIFDIAYDENGEYVSIYQDNPNGIADVQYMFYNNSADEAKFKLFKSIVEKLMIIKTTGIVDPNIKINVKGEKDFYGGNMHKLIIIRLSKNRH